MIAAIASPSSPALSSVPALSPPHQQGHHHQEQYGTGYEAGSLLQVPATCQPAQHTNAATAPRTPPPPPSPSPPARTKQAKASGSRQAHRTQKDASSSTAGSPHEFEMQTMVELWRSSNSLWRETSRLPDRKQRCERLQFGQAPRKPKAEGEQHGFLLLLLLLLLFFFLSLFFLFACLLVCVCVCVCVCVLLHASFWLHDLLLCLTMTRELHTCLCAGSNKTPQCGRDPAATQPPCGRLRCGYCSRVNLRKVCTRTQRLPCSEGVGVPAHTTLRARVCVCVRALMCLCLCWCLCLCDCLVSDGCRNTTSALLINMCPLLTLIVYVEWFNDNQSCSQCHAWIKMARRVCDCGMEFFTPKSAPLRPPQAMKDKSVTNCSNAIVKHVRVE